MNGVPVVGWVAIACVVLPLIFWGSPLGWPSAFKRWRARAPSAGPDAEASTAAAPVAARMLAMARPTLLLTPTKAPGFSKLGGEPELPERIQWPPGFDGPRAFLAQLEVSDLHRSGGPDWLPAQGRLYAFHDTASVGLADLVQIIYSADPAGAPMSAPAALARKLRFPERRVGFERFISVPNLEWMGVDERLLRGADSTVWKEVAGIADAPIDDSHQHRVGGYPNEIQETRMPLECEHLARDLPPPVWGADVAPDIERASESWRLLLQIDSDPALGMNWGDGGRLYVFVREDDARAADFSRTVTLFQCY